MLIMSRRKFETIHLGHDIVITVVEVRGDKARIGIDCPRELQVWRGEIYQAIQSEQRDGNID